MQRKRFDLLLCSKRKRLLFFTIFLSVLICAAPSFAADWDTIPDMLVNGATYDLSGLPADANQKIITVPAGAKVSVTGNPSVTFKRLKFVLLQSADLTIQDLRIDNSYADTDLEWHAIDVQGTGTTIILVGSNDLQGNGRAAAVHVPQTKSVTITSSTKGSLTAAGYYGAGIGGAWIESAGTITIWGSAVVNATAKDDGAAIGGGYGGFGGVGGSSDGGNGGTVNISGSAVVTATAKGDGAAIGGGGGSLGGAGGGGGTVNISGSAVVTATAEGNGAAIGGGRGDVGGGDGGTVDISGSAVVDATAKGNGAAIGGGYVAGGDGGGGGTVNISGSAVVDATAKGDGVAIGGGDGMGGNGGNGGTVNISGSAVVTATAGDAVAIGGGGGGGVFGGNGGNGGTVNISGGAVLARSEGGNDIGPGKGGDGFLGGEAGNPATVKITGGSVNARKDYIDRAPVNSAGVSLDLTSRDYPDLGDQTLVFTVVPTVGEQYEYKFRVPSDDKAYLWLPAGVTPPALIGSAVLSAGDVFSPARNTLAVRLTASAGDSTTLLRWERISDTGAVLASGDISSGSATIDNLPSGPNRFRVKGVWEAYGLTSADVSSNIVTVEAPDVKASDVKVTADSLPIPIREDYSAEITYTFTSNNDPYIVTSIDNITAVVPDGSGFGITISGDNQAVLATGAEGAGTDGSYSASFDVTLDGKYWIGPVGIALKIERAAEASDVEFKGNNVLQNIRIGDSIDESYFVEKTASDLNELEASIGRIVSSDNWNDSGLSVDIVSTDTFTVTGTAGAPGVYELSVDLKLGSYDVATESVSFTISANPEDITVTPDSNMEGILHGDNVDAAIGFNLNEFPDAEIKVISADGTSENWNESNLLVTVAPDGKTVSVIGEAAAPGEYEITVRLEINGVPVELTIPVVIAAKPEDVIVTPSEGGTDPENITEGDDIDLTYDFGSNIPGAIIEIIGAEGADGWDLSGLQITVNPDGTISITGTAKTPGDYAINVRLTVNGVPVEDMQILLSILGKEAAWSKGNNGCQAAQAGFLAFALLPFIYRRKRGK